MDGEYFLYDLETGAKRSIGKDARVSFIDKENDYPVRHKPSYGIAGWTTGEKSVIVYDDTDLWELPVRRIEIAAPHRWRVGTGSLSAGSIRMLARRRRRWRSRRRRRRS